jgi:hypothetical protein
MALFKKFNREEVSNLSQVKSSVARGIRGMCVYQADPASHWPWTQLGTVRAGGHTLSVKLISYMALLPGKQPPSARPTLTWSKQT